MGWWKKHLYTSAWKVMKASIKCRDWDENLKEWCQSSKGIGLAF